MRPGLGGRRQRRWEASGRSQGARRQHPVSWSVESIRDGSILPPIAPEPDHRCRRFPPRRRNETTVLDTASTPTQKPIRDPETATPPAPTSPAPKPAAPEHSPAAPTAARPPALTTGAIRTLGSNPATAPIMLHPGDAIPHRRRVAVHRPARCAHRSRARSRSTCTCPAFPVLETDFQTTAAAIQLTLTGTMIGFALGQLIVGPLSDKVGRRIPLLGGHRASRGGQRRRRPGPDPRPADGRSRRHGHGCGRRRGGRHGDRPRPVRRQAPRRDAVAPRARLGRRARGCAAHRLSASARSCRGGGSSSCSRSTAR